MKLFDDDGHLFDSSFSLLLNDGSDELQRLEISEHLSFCDACLGKYLEALSQEPLITPMPSQTQVIQEAGKRRGMSLFYRRFTVVAATFLAMVLWSAGAFTWQYGLMTGNPSGRIHTRTQIIFEQTSQIGEKISEKYNRAMEQVQEWRTEESQKSSQKLIEKEIMDNGKK